MSDAVSVRSMLARSPTAISSNVRLRMISKSLVDGCLVFMAVSMFVDVQARVWIAAVDVVDVAGDGTRCVAHEECAQRADVVDLDLAPQRRAPARLGEELVELRECRTPRVS